MKLIVGLGNPGKEYEGTRHNIGFMVLDYFANSNNIKFDKKKFNGEYVETVIAGEKVILFKPMEYINLSGQAISKIINFYKIDIDDVFIIHDDLDIELGKYKLKPKGNDGGHNGIKSIISNISSNDFKRLKIGIGNNKLIDTKDYVLNKFNSEESEKILPNIKIATNIINDFIKMDFNLLMNKYN